MNWGGTDDGRTGPSSRDGEVWSTVDGENDGDDVYLVIGLEPYGYSLLSLMTGRLDAVGTQVLDHVARSSSCAWVRIA